MNRHTKRSPSPLLLLDSSQLRLRSRPPNATRHFNATARFSMSGDKSVSNGTLSKRILTPSNNEAINDLVIETARQLGAEGKRVINAHSRSDDIEFEWVTDSSAKEEPVESLMSFEGVDLSAVQTALRRAAERHVERERMPNVADPPMVIDLVSSDTSKNQLIPENCSTGYNSYIHSSTTDALMNIELQQTTVLSSGSMHDYAPQSSSNPSQHISETARDASADLWSPLSGDSAVLLYGARNCSVNNVSLHEANRASDARHAHHQLSDCNIGRENLRKEECFLYGRAESEVLGSRSQAPSPTSVGSLEASTEEQSACVKPTQPSREAMAHERVNALLGDFAALHTSGEEDELSDGDEDPTNASERYAAPAFQPLPTASGIQQSSVAAQSIGLEAQAAQASGRPVDWFEQSRMPSRSSDALEHHSRIASDVGQHSTLIRDKRPAPSNRDASGSSTSQSARVALHERPSKRACSGNSSKWSLREDPEGESSSSDESDLPARNPFARARRRHLKRQMQQPRVTSNASARGTTRSSSIVCEVNIPRTKFARGRRVLAPADSSLPFTTVAMRGDVHFIDQESLRRQSKRSLPFYCPDDTPDPHVVDACLLEDNTVVLGYDKGPCQASLICLVDQIPRRIDLAYRAHSTVQESTSEQAALPILGLSALAPFGGSSLRFLSGGFDKSIHVWTLKRAVDSYTANSHRLKITHSQRVQSLAYRPHDEMVFSCAGTLIYQTNITAKIAPDPIRVSDGRILQVHIHPQAPKVVVLEVDHLDHQVLVYDTRRADFKQTPSLRFGYRDPNTQPRSGFLKGSTRNSWFARPYGDAAEGVVRVWDYRRHDNVVACFHQARLDPIAHTVLSGSNVIAYGGQSVTIWDINSSA
ncbi:uncharacterized protein LAESUDRAFT_690047 [Laetiporus sulphureus 93-53]|uniref:WD40 repeat-like protein n=1 Tax=Laetiporus sulphureus 93-53 TaxID=1314785 RepID=A0A165IF86_9APHY|nr:uncharacterized protein LAESUDRAFT_690047 [Laetiporus sulphureus 93-53]KZT12991.1 hypothetical protein LAESUDRAFT_690047 [Laetiporus sulphureus 93-53]